MDKNSIIGLLIIALILILMGYFNKPSQEEIEKARQQKDSLRQTQQEQVDRESSNERKTSPADQQEKEKEPTQKETDKKSSEKDLKSRYGSFSTSAEGEKKLIVLENNKMRAKLSTKGGRPYSVRLKEYETYDKKPLVLFDGDDNHFGFNFFAGNRKISTNDLYFKYGRENDSIVAKHNEQSVKLRLYAGEDKYIEYEYSLKPDAYMLDFNIKFVGMSDVIPRNYSSLDLNWNVNTPQLEKGANNENNFTTIGYKYYQDDVDDIRSRGNDEAEEELNTRVKWIAFKQQFFSSILVAENHFENSEVSFKSLEDSDKYLKHMEADIAVPYSSDPNYTVPMKFYFGPNHYNTLKEYDMGFEELVDLGWSLFSWVSKYIIIPVFAWLDNSIANYGIIILLLTLMIKLALFPLTYKSYLSQAKMRVLKPEIDEINKKYPNKEDNMKKQRAQMDLYKKAGVNPMGGCLPLLLQFPFLIAMVRFFPSSFELRQESFLWADDLSSYDVILNLPFEVPFNFGDHISGFTLLMAATLIFTTRINSSQMSGAGQQMPGMKFFTTYLMPVMLLFIFNSFAAGLSYYFFLSNLITLGQTLVIRNFVDDEAIHKKLKENKKKPKKKSKWQARLEEAAKKKGYDMPKKK
ncbi:MAG: membrane protein insertase YidC [Bacteroidota bacterium]